MPELGTLLGVWAHPDDESYLMAGLMAEGAARGDRVVCVTATRGEAGSQDHDRWPPDRMAEIRERELNDSLAVLGVKEHHWLDYVDGTCDAVPHDEAVEKLAPIFEDVQPDNVLTFGPEGLTGHPDHMAVSKWTADAFERYAKPGARLFHAVESTEWGGEFGAELEKNNVYAPGCPPRRPRDEIDLLVSLPDHLTELKLRALGAQVSQVEQLHALLGRDFLERSMREESFVLVRTKA